ncbi:hypothetical protein QVD17_38029 [Tagetes erecta]|uniref:Uncharacterized protein n=1 Tax=Tagetes erecta TaxID=13708 RepID=A0AAD8ND75_TARER|nr:hypothetical protein QVD17_38029 [Tagetes erecta]
MVVGRCHHRPYILGGVIVSLLELTLKTLPYLLISKVGEYRPHACLLSSIVCFFSCFPSFSLPAFSIS